jgi:hypothetical protein
MFYGRAKLPMLFRAENNAFCHLRDPEMNIRSGNKKPSSKAVMEELNLAPLSGFRRLKQIA